MSMLKRSRRQCPKHQQMKKKKTAELRKGTKLFEDCEKQKYHESRLRKKKFNDEINKEV